MDSDKNEKTNSDNNQTLLSLLKADSLGKVFAFFLGGIYLCGFFTLNSHYYKYGVVEVQIADSEYLLAGSVFVLYLTIYGIFAGRAIIFSKSQLGAKIKILAKMNNPAVSSSIAFIYMIIDVAFFHCLSVAFFSIVAYSQLESMGFYKVLALVFVFSYILDISNCDIRFPVAHLIIDGILKLIAVFSFFDNSAGDGLYILLLLFFAYSVYINLVIDSFERYEITKSKIIFDFIFTGVFIILSAVTFGSIIYGNVSKRVGGGEPQEMIIGLDENSLLGHPDKIKSPIVGKIVYSAQDNVYIQIEKNTLIISRSSVKWMSFPEKHKDDIFVPIEEIKKDTNEPVVQNEHNKPVQTAP